MKKVKIDPKALDKANELAEDITARNLALKLDAYIQADLHNEALKVEMETRMQAIRMEYSEKLTEAGKNLRESYNDLQQFVTNVPDALGGNEVIDLPVAQLGFRKGKPKVVCPDEPETIRLLMARNQEYCNIQASIQKSKLIADRNLKHVQELGKECGFEVVQEREFFVKVK